MKQIVAGIVALVIGCLMVGCTPTVIVPTTTLAPTTTTTQTTVITTENSTTTTQTTTTVSATTVTTRHPSKQTTKKTTTERKTTTTANTTTASTTIKTTTLATVPTVKPTNGEFRGMWVSYIELNSILSKCKTAQQGQEAIDGLMDSLSNSGMNAVFFHVRANSDAYYPSSLFKPAASVKKLLDNGFDPLKYAIESAHKRGMELHAWLNPYRVGKDASYIVGDTPTFQDGSGRYYYVPTSTAAQRLILDGIRELLNTYAIDGVQYDDYFYPEGLLAEETVYGFESADYADYTAAGGALSIGNWRRAGVDALVAATHTLTKAGGVVFGISPAHDAQKTHDKLFADSKKWLAQEGYVDYLCPQIYFGFEHSTNAFDTVTDRWLSYDRHPSVKLYVGIAMYKIGLRNDTYAGKGKAEWKTNTDILKRSVLYLREKKIGGIGFYSSSFLDPAKAVSIFKSDTDITVAEQEIENLLSIL